MKIVSRRFPVPSDSSKSVTRRPGTRQIDRRVLADLGQPIGDEGNSCHRRRSLVAAAAIRVRPKLRRRLASPPAAADIGSRTRVVRPEMPATRRAGVRHPDLVSERSIAGRVAGHPPLPARGSRSGASLIDHLPTSTFLYGSRCARLDPSAVSKLNGEVGPIAGSRESQANGYGDGDDR